MIFSLAGIAASMLLVALGAGGVEAVLLECALPGIVGAILTAGGIIAVHLVLRYELRTKETRMLLEAGCPRWMRWLAHGVSLSGLVTWIYLMQSGYESPADEVPTLLTGAIGLTFFPTAFLTFYAFLRLRTQPLSTCNRGHLVPAGVRACPQCGEAVRPVG
ncbi:MAG: hypothetical protein AMXMBFR36_29220 [Acidobacteriota bacterium]